jgi:hypothetical protein
MPPIGDGEAGLTQEGRYPIVSRNDNVESGNRGPVHVSPTKNVSGRLECRSPVID